MDQTAANSCLGQKLLHPHSSKRKGCIEFCPMSKKSLSQLPQANHFFYLFSFTWVTCSLLPTGQFPWPGEKDHVVKVRATPHSPCPNRERNQLPPEEMLGVNLVWSLRKNQDNNENKGMNIEDLTITTTVLTKASNVFICIFKTEVL